MAAPERVLLFGLSANPPTGLGGHMGMVRELVKRGGFDELWVLPVFEHMFAKKRHKLAPFEDRLRMCELAFGDLATPERPLRVVETEREVTEALVAQMEPGGELPRVGTADVMDHLCETYPDTSFSFAMGADVYRDLSQKKWNRADDLLRRLRFVVFERQGPDAVGKVPPIRSQDDLVQVPHLTSISSTEIRASLDPRFLRENLKPEVVEYIQDHELYAIGARRRLFRRLRLGVLLSSVILAVALSQRRTAEER